MPKVKYDNIIFDSELEVNYYQYLKEQNLKFIYHPKIPIYINFKNKYYPDFIVFYDDKIEIIETKGYSQYSFMKDNMIHNFMLNKTVDELLNFLYDNEISKQETIGKDIVYRKIKFLKSIGWVDFDFKNPNTLLNKRKSKISDLSSEISVLRDFKKKVDRYFTYTRKMRSNEKLTKNQKEWIYNFEKENNLL